MKQLLGFLLKDAHLLARSVQPRNKVLTACVDVLNAVLYAACAGRLHWRSVALHGILSQHCTCTLEPPMHGSDIEQRAESDVEGVCFDAGCCEATH